MEIVSAQALEHMQAIIRLFGGCKTAAIILGESESTLEKITQGNLKKMGAATLKKWQQRQYRSHKDAIAVAAEQIEKLQQNRLHRELEYEFEREYQEKVSELEEEKYKILTSSILGIFTHAVDYDFLHEHDFGDALRKVIKKEEGALNKLYQSWEKLVKTYRHFRPISIGCHEHYWGTVKLMDSISQTLAACFGREFYEEFSVHGRTMTIVNVASFEQMMRNTEIESIDWERLIEDIEHIKRAIICQIGKDALSCLYLCREMQHRFDFDTYVKAHLDGFLVEDWQAQCTINPDSIVINGVEHQWENEQNLKKLLYKKLGV